MLEGPSKGHRIIILRSGRRKDVFSNLLSFFNHSPAPKMFLNVLLSKEKSLEVLESTSA
jgi:hypothetical protein